MGLLTAGVAIAVAHLVAGFVGREASPVIAVGSTAIDLTPEWLKSFAIRTFGSNDKTVLLIGIENRASGLSDGDGLGLLGMAERIAVFDGRLIHGLTDDGRFVVTASLPLVPDFR